MTILKNRLSYTLIAAALACGSCSALAQASATKAVPAKGKPKAGPDKIMSKEELRACMALKDGNNKQAAELELRNEQNRKEKQAIQQSPDSAKADRAGIDANLAAVKQADALVRENGQAIQAWNDKMADFDKNSKDMRNADRRRQVLKQERFELTANDKKLVAERAEKITAYERSVAEYNAKIGDSGKAAEEWNKRNDALADDGERLSAARDKWLAECSNRRFREDDEVAIKAGK